MYSQTTAGEMPGASEMPVLVKINGVPFWQTSTGRTFPVVAGAEDPPPAGAKTEDPPKPKEGEGDGDEFDRDRALATIKKLREGEKSLKTQLKELETLKAEQRKREDAEKSEADRLKEQIADLERKASAAEKALTESRNRQAIERAANKAGAVDAEDVFKLLDSSDFDHDEAGNLTNAEKLVADLLKKKPHLAGKTGATNGVPGTPRGAGAVSHDEQVTKNREELRASPHYQPLG